MDTDKYLKSNYGFVGLSMTLYLMFKLSDSVDFFKKVPKKEVKIGHPKIENFTITGSIDKISGKGTQFVNSILSTETNQIPDPINVNFIIKQHKIPYCLVALNGRGLLTIHGYPKYVKELILPYLVLFFKNKCSMNIEFTSFNYKNENFKVDFWGKITSELAYCSPFEKEHMFIKISSPNFLKIVNSNPSLKEYFSNGTIKVVRGEIPELISEKNPKGLLKFDNYGVFRCEIDDIDFFNEHIEKLIDKGFFGGVQK